MKIFLSMMIALGVLPLPFSQAQSVEMNWIIGSSEKICQLTGDFDRELKKPTLNLTETRAGVAGTDLGFSFEHEGKLFFLFGDTALKKA